MSIALKVAGNSGHSFRRVGGHWIKSKWEDDEPKEGQGVYSLKKDKWIQKPSKEDC